ncbi:MAG: Hpt domain protein [Deltaproteobacteria bacterium ADurb.Bin510]|nr:MAG: Hpt domain protein [Deltaproteobacteria bacterium ADurb.Bin510]
MEKLVNEQPIFDEAKLLQRVGGNQTIMLKVIRAFLSSVPQQITELKTALANADLKDLHIRAHTLKGSTANVEALRIRALAQQIEEIAREGSNAGVAEIIAQVETEFDAFETHVRTELELTAE